MTDLRKFDAVVAPNGQVGMVVRIGAGYSRVMVQFGAAGPFKHFAARSLRLATREEVRRSGKEGVGGIVIRGKQDMNDKIDAYFAAKEALQDAFGYKPDWVEIPMDDRRGMYWILTNGEGYGSKCVWSPESFSRDGIIEGNQIYSGSVYTQRFLPRWVYRASTHVMVAVDTHTDGNKFLMIFDAYRECADAPLRDLYMDTWGNGL